MTSSRRGTRRRRARAAADGDACCGGSVVSLTDATGAHVFGNALYDASETGGAPDSAVAASLGCGVPTAVAALQRGETVLDLGSGAGADALISARRVGLQGKVYGLDMTDEALALSRANAERAGASNVEFLKGYIEVRFRALERPRRADACWAVRVSRGLLSPAARAMCASRPACGSS